MYPAAFAFIAFGGIDPNGQTRNILALKGSVWFFPFDQMGL
jgi:hypothetical protein